MTALAGAGLAGGATYDALVGAAACEAGLPLLTFDRRASGTYAVVGAVVQFVAFTEPR